MLRRAVKHDIRLVRRISLAKCADDLFNLLVIEPRNADAQSGVLHADFSVAFGHFFQRGDYVLFILLHFCSSSVNLQKSKGKAAEAAG